MAYGDGLYGDGLYGGGEGAPDYPADGNGYGKYLKIIGTDIEFNANQVAAYISSNLGGDFTVSNVNFCAALGSTYTSPAGDAAWWYDATRPESGEFLGAIITKIDGLNSTLKRKPMTHGSGIGGSILGPLRSGVRELKFEAMIYATTCRGMEYGKRAIIDALRGRGCRGNCALEEIEIWTCCPGMLDDEMDPEPIWRVKNVGLMSGPIEGAHPIPNRTCNIRSIEWTMGSESPWLYRVPDAVVADAPFEGDVDYEACMDVCDWIWNELAADCGTLTAQGIGETSGVIRISSGLSPFTGTIYAYEVIDGVPETEAKYEYQIYELPAGKTLVIDSSIQQLLVLDDATGIYTPDGSRYIVTQTTGAPFRFFSINGRCNDLQICVTTTPGTSDSTARVDVDSVHREL